MDEKWISLIEKFEKNGYEPEDIEMRVLFYDIMIEQHKVMKKFYEEEKHERLNTDPLHRK